MNDNETSIAPDQDAAEYYATCRRVDEFCEVVPRDEARDIIDRTIERGDVPMSGMTAVVKLAAKRRGVNALWSSYESFPWSVDFAFEKCEDADAFESEWGTR